MELEFTEDQQDLRASVRAVLERECPMSLVREVVEKGTGAERLWSRMVELGWPALTVPESAGGLGLGYVELAVVVEELGRAVAPVPYLATVSQFVPAVREAGDDGRFLALVADGSITGALVTSGVSADGGGALSGVAPYVLDGSRADELAVLAGDAVHVVPADAAGVTVEPVHAFDPSRPIATVSFDRVHVDDDRVLRGGGPDAGRRALEEATVALALETVGTCQAIFDVALAYAKDRHQFGVPIGSFQSVKHKFADLLVAVEKARATCYFAVATIAEDDARRTLATSMAKAAAGDCQRLLAQEGIQIHGGIGYTWEADVHLYVKRAKTGDALLGTAREHRARVADLIGL